MRCSWLPSVLHHWRYYTRSELARHRAKVMKTLSPMATYSTRLLLLPLLAAIHFLLAGCFQSDQPKFPLADAATPLGEGGRYAVYERGPDNRYQRQEVVAVKRRG